MMVQLKVTMVLMDRAHKSLTMCFSLSVSTVLDFQEMMTSAAIAPTGLDNHAPSALQIASLSV